MCLKGVKLVLTGKFKDGSRKDITAKLELLGADVTSNVSSRTSALIAGKDPGSKLEKARQKSIPILDETEMMALIGGKSLDDILKNKVEKTQEPSDVPDIPYPQTEDYPRDGQWSSHYPGTDQVLEQGEYENWRKHGIWKEYWPNGQIKKAQEWKQGLVHGEEQEWAENGTKILQGTNDRGLASGKWTRWYENGSVAETWECDDKGKKHGPYSRLNQDGSPKTKGWFKHGDRIGDWTYWDEQGYAKISHAFSLDVPGTVEAWYSKDQLAYRYFLEALYRRKDGQEVSFYKDGKPKFKGEWCHDVAIGEHVTWDEDGKASRISFEYGLPESLRKNEKLAARIAKKIKKARDAYDKEGVLASEYSIESGQEGCYLVFLWKKSLLDITANFELWYMLSNASGVFDGPMLMEFLAKAKPEKNSEDTFPYLPGWNKWLDDLVMDVYMRDPGPIDEAWHALPEKMKLGVATCLARFGKDTGELLAGHMDTLVDSYLPHGVTDSIVWPSDDRTFLVERKFLEGNTHTAVFEEYIEFFGGMDSWIEKIEAKLEKFDEDIYFPVIQELLERADPKAISKYCNMIQLNSFTQGQIHDVLSNPRFTSDELETIALGIEDHGLRKWPAVCTAIMGCRKEGKQVSQELLDALTLDTQTPTYSTDWFEKPLQGLDEEKKQDPGLFDLLLPTDPGSWMPSMNLMIQALSCLPKEQLREVFERHLQDYMKLYVIPYLFLLPDSDLVDRSIEMMETEPEGYRERWTYGIGELGKSIIPRFEQILKHTKTKKKKEGWYQAIIVALNRTIIDEGDFDAAWDEHVRFDVMKDDYYYQFLEPFIRRIVYRLPRDRAEKILLRGLQTSSYYRAFRCISLHPTQDVLQAAFRQLLQKEKSLKYEQLDAIKKGLQGLRDKREWIKWILLNKGGSGCKSALKDALGASEFDELEKEIADKGVQVPKEMDQIDRIITMAKQTAAKGDRIYLLRPSDKAPNGSDLNVRYGPAPGVGKDRWPVFNDEPMHHLFTLDVRTMPELSDRVGDDFRTVSLFISNPDMNEAYEPYNNETEIIFSTQEQVDAVPVFSKGVAIDEKTLGFDVVAVDVDSGVWCEESRENDLCQEIFGAGARVLGEPIWLQSDELTDGSFLLQFDESFVDVNLGDSGVMYVFSDSAFWQCY